jgi:hypothetical protein
MPLKITAWNIEHANALVTDSTDQFNITRIIKVRSTIEQMDPDVLCITEGPKGEQGIADFCANVLLDKWVPVRIDPQAPLGQNDASYQTKGTQWIWFVVKPHLLDKCRVQPPAVWQSFLGDKSTWKVNYWGIIKPTTQSHYRHPQVMLMDIGGGEKLEFIGVHLKSKINQKRMERDEAGNFKGDFLQEALEARVKLATEATNIRAYIGAKFNQVAAPGIMLLGDCNDGPGQDYFEHQYLFFDLIGNLQGEVLVAERFFNHALFDYPQHLRWTAKFADTVMGLTAANNPLLIDHILMSQPLVNGSLPFKVNEGAGKVEHEIFQSVNAGTNTKTRSSDHRPVSCILDDN